MSRVPWNFDLESVYYLLAAVIVSNANVPALGAATPARSSTFPRQISTP